MGRNLPSLNQLRAFEAAARHESIKKGAAELFVTQAAVSHQIKALEQSLNAKLFHRAPRKITLTEQGRALAAEVCRALDVMETAVTNVFGPTRTGVLKITVAPFFGNRWLLPRLEQFHSLHPDIEIEPKLSFEYVDLEGTDFDAALRFGTGEWSGLTATLIFKDQIGPVCAPQMVKGRPLPLDARDILSLNLASANRWQDDWSVWINAVDETLFTPKNITRFESRAYMFDAALSGNAVILADKRLTSADEEAGRLVRLHANTVVRPQGMYAVAEANKVSDSRLNVFIAWLRAEAKVST